MNGRELLDGDDVTDRPLSDGDLFATGGQRGERRMRRKDGTPIVAEYSCSVLEDARVHTALRDVTQRRREEEELRRSRDRVQAIVETQREIAEAARDSETLAAAIVERAQRLAGADGAAIQWREGDSFVHRFTSGIIAAGTGQRVPARNSISALAVETGETIHVPDVEHDPRVYLATMRQLDARSLICAPLAIDDDLVGVLAIVARAPHAFDDLAVETTRAMAQFVSTVYRNARELEERRELESRFRGAFNSSSVGISLTAPDGSYLEVNDRLAEMLGYSVEELLELGIRGVSHASEHARDRDEIARALAGEQERFQREKLYVRKDGSLMWGDLGVSAVRDPSGQVSYFVGVISDVTERREANLLFEASFSSSLVPNVIMDDDRIIVEVNEAAAALLGVKRADAVGLSVDELLPDEPHETIWPRFLAEGTAQSEVTLVRPDGEQRRIEYTATANVRPGRHIAVIRDLTQQKRLEEQLRQAQKMEAVGRLAGGIAHDFNNLLTAISGYSEFLADGIEDPRLHRHATEIKKAAARAAALTGQLLAFSRRQVLQPRVLDLNAVVSDMDSLLRRLIGEDVELVTMLDPAIGSVQADPTQIEQVIVNLAVNARDAMPNGGALTIETADVETEEASWVELRLTDTGVGMTDDERRQLFEPFFTTKDGGTGLGLATVYGIVEQSGGMIEVDSAPGMGSSFRIWLPRVAAEAEHEAPPSAEPAPAAGCETILLVEDEGVVRELVAEILESSGYSVLQAADGPSALELLRRHSGRVDLLVTDVVMPGMSGPEVAQAVTAMRPGTQVLYTSGYTDSAIGHHGVLEPGIAFLQKPFSADDLTRKVRQLLDEHAPVA
jgi:PAS domain S-box-containing protein